MIASAYTPTYCIVDKMFSIADDTESTKIDVDIATQPTEILLPFLPRSHYRAEYIKCFI